MIHPSIHSPLKVSSIEGEWVDTQKVDLTKYKSLMACLATVKAVRMAGGLEGHLNTFCKTPPAYISDGDHKIPVLPAKIVMALLLSAEQACASLVIEAFGVARCFGSDSLSGDGWVRNICFAIHREFLCATTSHTGKSACSFRILETQ